MIKESLFVILFVVVCVIGFFGLRFFKTDSSEEGFTDIIGDGDSVHLGYTDYIKPDLTNRPDDGTFWSSKYTPVWLRKGKEKEEE